jgi:triacylglycerol esterase/lipase EstA (alpha/beta hydrolase family)
MYQAEGLFSVMIKELLTLVDIAALFSDPAFYGVGTARGNGKQVVVIPGLFGSDVYLQPLHKWLRCAGYSPVPSSLNLNAGCLERLSEQVLDQITRQMNGNGGTIALIGHSRGGLLAWAMASRLQERVSHLVMLGSPVASMVASVETGKPIAAPVGQTGRALMRVSSLVRHVLDPDCDYPRCGCPFIDDVMRPLSPRTAILSVYGRDDMVVEKAAQITEGETLEVNASHVGLVYNPEVYRAIGSFLARESAEPLSDRFGSGLRSDPGL